MIRVRVTVGAPSAAMRPDFLKGRGRFRKVRRDRVTDIEADGGFPSVAGAESGYIYVKFGYGRLTRSSESRSV